MKSKIPLPALSGSALKWFAAICMLCDHMGLLLFPRLPVFRWIGRLAFPIFAFCIAEGCRFTRNRLRYFGTIFLLAVLFQAVYTPVTKDWRFSIFFTFSLSIALIYLLDEVKKSFVDPTATSLRQGGWLLAFAAAVICVYYLDKALTIDYQFWGCLTPVFASLFNPAPASAALQTENRAVTTKLNALAMTVPLVLLTFVSELKMHLFCLCALPILLLYSGKRGKYSCKYFFYVFYPAHLVLLYGISLLLK